MQRPWNGQDPFDGPGPVPQQGHYKSSRNRGKFQYVDVLGAPDRFFAVNFHHQEFIRL